MNAIVFLAKLTVAVMGSCFFFLIGFVVPGAALVWLIPYLPSAGAWIGLILAMLVGLGAFSKGSEVWKSMLSGYTFRIV